MILDFVPNRVRKMLQDSVAVSVSVGRSPMRCVTNAFYGFEHFGTKRIRGKRVAVAVPNKRIGNVALCPWGEDQVESFHKAEMRARASAQGTDWAIPARKASFRERISSAQDFATSISASPSKLSRSANTSADRSSGASVSASSIRWSTRAFIDNILPAEGGQLAPENVGRRGPLAKSRPAEAW